jgi:hypothetical protein
MLLGRTMKEQTSGPKGPVDFAGIIVRAEKAAEKRRIADERAENHPSGAKAQPLFCCVYGTAEAVPFQSNEFFRSL